MKVLVTGATGFLGQAIVDEFLSNKIEVVSLSRSPNFNVTEHYQVDISVEKTFAEIRKIKNVEAIVHAAGLAHQFGKTSREKFLEVNVQGTVNVLNLAKELEIKHFILISSVSVYGDNSKFQTSNSVFQEESECNPIGDYAQSKYESEQLAIKFCVENSLRLTILRPATIIGEGDKGNVMRLITTIKNNKFFWIGKGKNLKSLVDKNDVAKVCRTVLQVPQTEFQIYNVTTKPLTMYEIVETISAELQIKIPKLYVPTTFAKFVGKFVKTIRKWLSDDIFSDAKLRSMLGVKMPTDIKESLRREVRSLEN